jgi:hypothetical protein
MLRFKPSVINDACHYSKAYTEKFFDCFPSQQTTKNTDDTIHQPTTLEP